MDSNLDSSLVSNPKWSELGIGKLPKTSENRSVKRLGGVLERLGDPKLHKNNVSRVYHSVRYVLRAGM